MDEEGDEEEEDIISTAGRMWRFGKATLDAQQLGAQRGAMVNEEGAGEEENVNHTARLLYPFGEGDAVAAGQRTEEPDVVENGVDGRPTSVISRRRVQREALSIITIQRTISTRQHPVEDETDPKVTFKTLPRATVAVAKPWSRTTATRGGIATVSGRVTDWAQTLDIGLNTIRQQVPRRLDTEHSRRS